MAMETEQSNSQSERLIPFLEARGLTQIFSVSENQLIVFEDLSFSLQKGEMVAVTGESGSGKSTLLYLLGGLEPPTQGEILIGGAPVQRTNRAELAAFRNRSIGFVFQFHYLLPEFTALENVCIPRLIQGQSLETARADARQLLEEVGLGDRLLHRVGQISGGEQQRVALARALINRPKLLLADEPTGNLDFKTSASVMSLLRRLHQQHGLTSVIATHSHDVASQGDRLFQLAQGRLFEVDKNSFAR